MTTRTAGPTPKGSCPIHPEYTAQERPAGFPCVGCEVAWITAEAYRYSLLEAAFRAAGRD
jgi:hypothetical protein